MPIDWVKRQNQARKETPPVAVPPGALREYAFTLECKLIPAPRLTRDQVLRDVTGRQTGDFRDTAVQRYLGFTSEVRASFLDIYGSLPFVGPNMLTFKKPFAVDPHFKGVAAFVDGALRFKPSPRGGCEHGDPDNIMKSIIDGLFGGVARWADAHVCPRVMSLDCNAPENGADIVVIFPKP